MTIKHAKVDVGAAATSLLSVTTGDRSMGRSMLLTNEGTLDVCVGGENVTTTEYGVKLAPGGQLSLDCGNGDIPYAIAASGTQTVRVLHSGV